MEKENEIVKLMEITQKGKSIIIIIRLAPASESENQIYTQSKRNDVVGEEIKREREREREKKKVHLIYNKQENYSLMISITTTESNQSFLKCEREE
jgi:hypothetical protein